MDDNLIKLNDYLKHTHTDTVHMANNGQVMSSFEDGENDKRQLSLSL